MKRWSILKLTSVFGLVMILSACLLEQLSWSPDGRYLVFASGDAGTIWRWDNQKRQMQEIKLHISSGWTSNLVTKKINTCRYFPAGDQIALIGMGEGDT